MHEAAPLRFRLEVLRSSANPPQYSIQAWRAEYFRLQPSFPQVDGVPQWQADEEVYFVDSSLDWSGISADSAEAALTQALQLAQEWRS